MSQQSNFSCLSDNGANSVPSIKGDPREVIFENPQHDFPQRVIYRLQSDGSLVGRIEGVTKGKEKAVDFPMSRERCDD